MLKYHFSVIIATFTAITVAIAMSRISSAKEPAHLGYPYFLAVQAAENPPKAASPADQLPAGDGRDITLRLCSQCHAVTTFSRLRYTKDKWDSVLDDMVSKGLNASDDDLTLVEKYLTTYLVRSPDTNPPSNPSSSQTNN